MQNITEEIKDIEFQMQRLHLEICNLENEKKKAIESGCSEDDLLIFDSQIHEIEIQLEQENKRYNNLFQLKEHQLCCNHVFVEDLIDIHPDQSITIRYCSDCLFTCKN